MKKIVAIAALVCSMSLAALAQAPQAQGNKHGKGAQNLESEKIAFLTRQMDLSPEEAQVFWPVYNKIEKKQKAAVKAEREAFKALNMAFKEEKPEAEISNLLDAYLKAKEANVDFHAKGVKDYKKVLPAAKVAKFFAAQERFRRQQIRNLQGGQHHGKPGRFGHPGMPQRPSVQNTTPSVK